MSMYELDHIVHFVNSPEQAMKDMLGNGLHVVEGGQHEQWGTYNVLSYLGSKYIEFIGINDMKKFAEAAKAPYTLHETYESSGRINGFKRIAIRTTTIEQDAHMFQEAGFEVYGPDHFSRTRPDGSIVSWQLLHIGHKNQRTSFPFFIQWDKSNEERESENIELGIAAPHVKGNVNLTEIVYLIDHLDSVKKLQILGGLKCEEMFSESLNAQILILHLPNVVIKIYCPCGEGPVWDAVLTNGLGIQYITFTGANEDQILDYENARYIFLK